jgi:hypothetical protein
VALSQFGKPIVLKRNTQCRFETDDGENGDPNIGGIAIEAVYKCDMVAAAS